MSATLTAFPRTAPSRAASSDAAVGPVRWVGRAASAQTAGRSHLHITRRGRAVLTVAVVVAVLALVVGYLMSGTGAVATSSTGDVHFEHVTVAAGETLWEVAQDVAPSADPRDVIADISQLNNLQSTDIMPGQSLAIPTKYASTN